MKILDILKLTDRQKNTGIWLSGTPRHGEYKAWYDNGQLLERSYWKKNYLNGRLERWHYNGNLHIQCTYKMSALQGEIKKWSEDGTVEEHRYYKDSILIRDYLNESNNT